MTKPAFSEDLLANAIAPLTLQQQLAFGAAVCERMLPNYRKFADEVGWGNAELLRKALDVIWSCCSQAPPSEFEVRRLLAEVEKCTPDSDDFESLYRSSAQEAVFAICSLLDFLLRADTKHILKVGRFATDSIDLIVQEREGMDPQDPNLERRILQHPLMQQELHRQKRDAAELRTLNTSHELSGFRARAQGEQTLVT